MRDQGFTLVEVLVALTLTALVATTVVRLTAITFGAAAGIGARAEAMDREMNAQRWLQGALEHVSLGDSVGGVFDGSERALDVTCWTMGPEGWPQRDTLHLRVDEGSVIAVWGSGAAMRLWTGVQRAQVEYLLVPGAQSRWVPVWRSPVRAPIGLRMVLVWADVGRAPSTLVFNIRGVQ